MNQKYKRRLIFVSIFILFIIILRFSGIYKVLSFQNFKEHKEYFLDSVNRNYWFSVLVFIAFYILITLISFPIAGLITSVGGFLFGVIPGAIYSDIGATIGATISFLIFRYLIGHFIQEKYETKLEKFNKNIEQYGSSYLLTLNLFTVVPFFLIIPLAALTKISLWSFIWATAIGIIPGSLVYSYAGRQLGTINSINEILSPQVLIAFALLGLLGVISILIKKYKIFKHH